MDKQSLPAKHMLLAIIISIITCGSINNNVYAQNTLDEEKSQNMH